MKKVAKDLAAGETSVPRARCRQALAREVSFVVLCLSLTSLEDEAYAQASAFTRAPGEALFIVQGSWVRAAERFTFDGEVVDYESTLPDEIAFVDSSFYLNVELGVVRGLTATLDVPYRIIEVQDATFVSSVSGVGDLFVGVRLGLFELVGLDTLPFFLSLEPRIKLPAGYTRNRRPSVGPGQIDLDLHLAVGVPLPIPIVPGYFQARVGYRLRTDAFALSSTVDCPSSGMPGADCFQEIERPEYADEILYGAELGFSPFDAKVLVFFKVNGLLSVDAPDTGFNPANPIPERQRFLKLGAGGILYPVRWFTENVRALSHLGILGQYFITPTGQNTIKSDELFCGLIYQVQLL